MASGEGEVAAALEDLRSLYDAGAISSALVESVIAGAEYSVGFFDDACLGVIEITPADGFYDFASKYESHDTTYTPVDGALADEVAAVAAGAWRALGCRGVGRVDVMGRPGQMYALEVNTIPGMTATSLVPKLAAARGVPFDEFAALMLCAARGGRFK
jgi:D-alanine-D-alanine ligase